ncbi:hypothetical protein, partial [Promicromonospora kroppenstedtii]|uniref:hypothetical protein n=1 Tax=Promicromonospora kroppenstedtii TaxID=440482 RepID=UPI00055C77C1
PPLCGTGSTGGSFTPIALGFRIMGLGLRIVFERVIRPVWNGIKTVASAAWDGFETRRSPRFGEGST